MGDKKVYVHNTGRVPVTAKARDEKGRVLWSKVFMPERMDNVTGRIVSTGYTTLTEDEFEKLSKTSRGFKHYKDELKILVVVDDLPASAKAPHEALADARKGEQAALAKVSELEAEVARLKVATDEEKLKPIKDGLVALVEKHNENAKRNKAVKELLEELSSLPWPWTA